MADRLSNPAPQHFYPSGAPLDYGEMFFYVDSSTTTLKDTYTTEDLDVPNSNPVRLSPSGLEPDIFLDGEYSVVLKDKNGVQIWSRDNVNTATFGVFGTWISTRNYGSGGDNIVTGSDGNYYVSIQAPNLAQDPISSPLFWDDFTFVTAGNDITALTFTATGAVSAGDNASMGYSASNGLELIGQGSTNDWNLLNDTAASVIRCPTGTVNPVFAGTADFAAAGIVFDDEILDTYDEGTWTPVLSDGTNNATMNGATYGRYTRIGNRVWINCRVFISAIGSVSSSAVQVTGLPFTPSSDAGISDVITGGQSLSLAIPAASTVVGSTSNAGAHFNCFVWDSTTGTTGMSEAEWGTVGQIYFTGCYGI